LVLECKQPSSALFLLSVLSNKTKVGQKEENPFPKKK
jgi:hypothetical protein